MATATCRAPASLRGRRRPRGRRARRAGRRTAVGVEHVDLGVAPGPVRAREPHEVGGLEREPAAPHLLRVGFERAVDVPQHASPPADRARRGRARGRRSCSRAPPRRAGGTSRGRRRGRPQRGVDVVRVRRSTGARRACAATRRSRRRRRGGRARWPPRPSARGSRGGRCRRSGRRRRGARSAPGAGRRPGCAGCIARARSSSSRKLTASRSCGSSGSGIVAGSPSKVSGSRPSSRSRCQRSRLSSTPASESAAETSRSAVGRSGTTRWIGIVPASSAVWIAAPSSPSRRAGSCGDCGSLNTRLPSRPGPLDGDAVDAERGRVGLRQHHVDRAGQPGRVGAPAPDQSGSAGDRRRDLRERRRGRAAERRSTRRPSRSAPGAASRSMPISISSDSGSCAARSSPRQ